MKNRQRDRQTNRWTDGRKLKDKQTDRCTDIRMLKVRQTDRQIEGQKDSREKYEGNTCERLSR